MTSVITPAGLVKLMTLAWGAYRVICSTRSSTTGIPRKAYEIPPAPTVSWPMTPRARHIDSSKARPRVPATRMAEKMKSVPAKAVGRSVVATTDGALGRPGASWDNTVSMTPSRRESVS